MYVTFGCFLAAPNTAFLLRVLVRETQLLRSLRLVLSVADTRWRQSGQYTGVTWPRLAVEQYLPRVAVEQHLSLVYWLACDSRAGGAGQSTSAASQSVRRRRAERSSHSAHGQTEHRVSKTLRNQCSLSINTLLGLKSIIRALFPCALEFMRHCIITVGTIFDSYTAVCFGQTHQ